MQRCTHRTACSIDRQHTRMYVCIHVYMWEGLENVLEIGDLDSRMRVDFLVARRLSLDIAVELFEKDLIAQDFGATNRAMSIPWCPNTWIAYTPYHAWPGS